MDSSCSSSSLLVDKGYHSGVANSSHFVGLMSGGSTINGKRVILNYLSGRDELKLYKLYYDRLKNGIKELVKTTNIKVIPQFCTANRILRITSCN